MDGTYRLHIGGWVLCEAGTITITWNNKRKAYAQSFIPLAYMFCRTECRTAYAQLFDVIKNLPIKLLGFGSQLNVDIIGIDRTSYIKDAIEDAFPDAFTLDCWPQLARTIKEGEFKKALLNADNMGPVEECIHSLHACRSEAQFDLLGCAVLNFWTEVLLKAKFAQYFKKIYMDVRVLLPRDMHVHAHTHAHAHTPTSTCGLTSICSRVRTCVQTHVRTLFLEVVLSRACSCVCSRERLCWRPCVLVCS